MISLMNLKFVPQIESIDIDYIHVGDQRRAVNEEAVAVIARSMAVSGMINPITLRIVNKVIIDGEEVLDVPVLVAGAHCLAAAKRLGWERVPAFLIDGGDETDARLWEIADDLPCQLGTVGHRPKGGVNEAARELGLSQGQAHRAVKVAAIAPEAKAAAKDAGLDDNQSALLKVAKEPTAEAQVAKVNEITTEKTEKKIPKPRQSREQGKEEAMADAFNLIESLVTSLLNRIKPATEEERREIFKLVHQKIDDLENETEEGVE